MRSLLSPASRRDRSQAATLSRELAELDLLTVGELAKRYRELVGIPSRSRNRDHLKNKIAWHMQARAEGGLSPGALERIERLAPTAPARWHAPAEPRAGKKRGGKPRHAAKKRVADSRVPKAGTVVTRVYAGKKHRVTVLEKGFEYLGKYYRSLSKIALEITGTSWSGYRFFFGDGPDGAKGDAR